MGEPQDSVQRLWHRAHGGPQIQLLATSLSSHRQPDIVADPQPFADYEWFDLFSLVYWGIAILILGGLYLYLHQIAGPRRAGTKEEMAQSPESKSKDVEGGASSHPADEGSKEVPQTVWAVALLAALGQARWASGSPMQILAGFGIGFGTGVLQVVSVLLIVVSMNPGATPITTQPATAWHTYGWTVNAMKWLVCFFFCACVTNDAGEFMETTMVALASRDRCSRFGWFLSMLACGLQYCVLLLLTYAGAVCIMVHQDVPNIVFSGLSITFIAQLDDTMFEFLKAGFAIEVDTEVDEEEDKAPLWFSCMLRALMLFPTIMGTYVLAHSMYLNRMPNIILRYLDPFLAYVQDHTALR